MPRRMCLWVLSTLLLVLTALHSPVAAQDGSVVVYLVRHAERAEDGTKDPPVSEAGRERADLLARMLRDAGITDVYSTDFKRTRQTATPTVRVVGRDLHIYDPRDLRGFAATLAASPGRHLVVGHSNTTPALVRALGGDPGEAVDEAEYDRLYVLVLRPSGTDTVLLRFGAPFRP